MRKDATERTSSFRVLNRQKAESRPLENSEVEKIHRDKMGSRNISSCPFLS